MYTQIKQRLAIGFTGALLALSLVAGVAPVAADGNGPDGQDDRPQNQAENQDRDVAAPDTYLSITSVTVAPMANPDIAAVAPLDEARFIVGGDDRGA